MNPRAEASDAAPAEALSKGAQSVFELIPIGKKNKV
jgi:hypothetical protein